MTPRVDIIIPTYSRPDMALPALQTIIGLQEETPYRIILVNNGGDQKVASMCRWFRANTRRYVPWARYHGTRCKVLTTGKNLGFSGGNNYAAKYAKAEWLLFLNDDAFPQTQNWLTRMIGTAEAQGASAVGPESDYVLGLQHMRFKRAWPMVHPVKFLSGFCLLIKRKVFEKLGGWDERFFNGDEDLDLSIRLRQNGYGIVVDRSVFVHHKGEQTLTDVAAAKGITPKQWYQQTRDQLIQKHGAYVQFDLFETESLRVPPTMWRERGVLPNGFFFARPGQTSDQLSAMGKLRAGTVNHRGLDTPGLTKLYSTYEWGGDDKTGLTLKVVKESPAISIL